MSDIDALLAEHPPEPETAVTAAATVRRHRHQWLEYADHEGAVCAWCGKPKDEARSRRGRTARQRGNRYELELATRLGGVKVGHHGGPEDVRAGMFVVQSKVRKAFPEWMTTELAKLPRTDGRIPLLVVADSPGPGHRRQAIVVLSLEDWTDLHGPEAAA